MRIMEKPLKIFILEDLDTDIELIKRQCLKFNSKSTFIVASNKVSFFEKIEWFKPDLILSDYGLPDINGLEALLFVRQNLAEIPFIFVTGNLNDDEKVARAILEGANGFIIKKNLSKLPETMKEVITKNNEKLDELKRKEEEAYQRKFLLEKLEALIIKLTPDTTQDALQIVKKLQITT